MNSDIVAQVHAKFPSYDLFGMKVTPTTSDDLIDILRAHVTAPRQCAIVSQNLHGMQIRRTDRAVAQLDARPDTYVHLDGMPLVALCRLAGIPANSRQRVTLVDWIWPLLETAARESWRIFYLGARPEVLAQGLATIRKRFPDLVIDGRDGYFADQGDEADDVIARIRDFAPHVLLVGMGMGRQEHWILRSADQLAPTSICTVGACIEYVAGAVRTPPRWMGRYGLEWAFRFAENPARFWHRYLIEPWGVFFHIVAYTLRSRAARRAT